MRKKVVCFCFVWFFAVLLTADDLCIESDVQRGKLVNCSGVGLSRFPEISKNVAVLDLSRNRFTSLEVLEEFYNLDTLILSKNNLVEVRIPPLLKLTHLDLSNNSIRDCQHIETGASHLQELNLDDNNIRTLGSYLLRQHPHIKRLKMSRNPVGVVTALSSSTLEELYLSNTQLHFIRNRSFVNLTALTRLYLSHNQHLVSLDRDGQLSLPHLQVLQVSHSILSEIHLGQVSNLTSLDMSHNNIYDVTLDSLVSNLKLSKLNLSFNKIMRFDSKTLPANLTYLDLSNNKISELIWTSPMDSLLTLNLSFNEVKIISNLKSESLRVLQVTGNCIKILPQDWDAMLPRLKSLEVNENKVRAVSKVKSATLEMLNLSACKITWVHKDAFKEAPQLKELDLADNKIKDVEFMWWLLKLQSLKVEDNVWSCDCREDLQTRIRNSTLTVLVDLECGPDNLTWDQFCAMHEVFQSEIEEKERHQEEFFLEETKSLEKDKIIFEEDKKIFEENKKMFEEDKKIFEEEKQLKKVSLPNLSPCSLGQTDSRTAGVAWLVGGSTVLLALFAVGFWWKISGCKSCQRAAKSYRRRKTHKTDVLGSIQMMHQNYQYVYVEPPLEEVELRRSALRRTTELRFEEVSSQHSVHSTHSAVDV